MLRQRVKDLWVVRLDTGNVSLRKSVVKENWHRYSYFMGIFPWLVSYGMGDAPEPKVSDVYVQRLEHIYKLAAALKEAEETEAPRWQCVNAKHQLFAALEP